ncbi:MAG TPA: xanthine dehydrogenase family protein subunit M [Gemmataceae bacterium]|nr:xanthine dehydrogenase family protein subunit M [Gemmataceae bacterium]
MKNFTYYRPQTTADAVGLLDDKWGTSELLAGGTDLIDLQKQYIAQPDKVIGLSGIKGFSGIQTEGEQVVIQAGTKLADIAEHAELRKLFPGLTSAAQEIGGPQIRNMGTLGGNLCQRNRCWYFRDEPTVCLLKGGERCFALDGENRYHAIFTQGHKCVIVNPSTLAPVLAALGAEVSTMAAGGGRKVAMDQFFQAPSSASEREHVLKPNEMVVSVSIPKSGARNASYEVRHKQAYDWPLVQAAVAFALDDGKASKVKIILGHVAPTPRAAEDAAKALEGKTVNEESAAAAGKAAAEGAKPLAQNDYKVKLVWVAVKRAILTAGGQKRYWEA